MGILNNIYIYSPWFLKNFLVSLYGIKWYKRRYGKLFFKELPNVIERESWDRERLEEYQLNNLRNLLEWAYLKVPYYRNIFDSIKIKPRDIKSIEDLQNLPLLKRDHLREYGNTLLLANGIAKYRLNYYYTSGSTYAPLKIAYGPGMHSIWTAFYEARCRHWAGVTRNDARSNIGGRIVVAKNRKKPPYWVYNWVEKQLYLSSFHLSLNTIKDYQLAFEKYKPYYHCGYAYSTYLIAQLLNELDLEIPPMKAVLCSSENLTYDMRKMIEKKFNCKTFNQYSQVEACCLASECEEGNMHISMDLGIIEITDENGNQLKEGEIGEIVATGFLNYAQPLIRYRTGDYGSISYKECSCGRKFYILDKIMGRSSETLLAQDGKTLGAASFAGVFYGNEGILESQIIQESLTDFSIKIVPSKRFNDKSKELLIKRLKERLGDVNIKIIIVDKIEKTQRGKYKPVVNNIL